MLVFALVFMFLSGVSANETVDVQSSDSVSVEPLVSHENNLDTSSSNDVDEKVSQQISSERSYQSSDNHLSEKNKSDTQDISNQDTANQNASYQNTSNQNTTYQNTTNQNTINHSIENNSVNRKEIKELYNNILSLNEDDCKKLSSLMKELEDEDFDDCCACLIHHNPEKLLHLLETMEDEEYYTIYIMVYDLKHGTLDYGSDDNDKIVKSTSNHLTSSNNGHYQASYKKYNKNYKSSPNKIYYKNNFSKKILEKYLNLNELFDDYFEGKISYYEFINGLKSIGYDTSDLLLNDDGTILWRGATIPAPNDRDADEDVPSDDKVDVNELEENTNNVEEQQDTAMSSTPVNSTI